MKEIRVAKSAGFCFGVSRSVDMAEKLLAEHGGACSLGPIIHNEDVVAELGRRGLRVISDPSEVRPGDQVMIRAHGAAPSVYAALEERGAVVTDATCPKVKMIHRIVRKAAEEGRFVVVIGMREHPEVEAICGWLISNTKGWHITSSAPAFANSFRRNFPALFAPPRA